jgi:hypothetical protein
MEGIVRKEERDGDYRKVTLSSCQQDSGADRFKEKECLAGLK